MQLPEHLREFDDADKTRDLIYTNVLTALKSKFPVEDDEYRLELANPRYTGSQRFSLNQQKHALMNNRQLQTPIKGTWRLFHKPSKTVMDEREDIVMHVPYYTQRGTFILGGNEYSVVNQSRLKPGVYVRRRKTGEVETQFNIKSGTGVPFHLRLEPETGVFKVNVGQANMPLYNLLKLVGVDDKTLVQQWGHDIYAANTKRLDPRADLRLYQQFAGNQALENPSADVVRQYLAESLPKFQLDPGVVARTMGLSEVNGIDSKLLLRAAQKMLNVSRGSETQDDRDSPMFSNIYSVEDLLSERVEKDAGHLLTSLLTRVKRAKNLSRVYRGALDPYISGSGGFLLASRLTLPLEETNPLSTLEQMTRITKLGQGGIQSAEAITPEARNVNNGQFGFLDPISGPEGLNIGIDVRTAYRTFKGNDKQLYGEFKDTRTGKMAYLTPSDVYDRTVAFPGELQKRKPYVSAMVQGEIKQVPVKDVDFEVPSFGHLMSSHINLNPLPTGVQAGRQFYASKFWSQYLPLVKGEVPLVSNLTPDGDQTYGEYYGKRIGGLTASQAGTITRVTKDEVTLTDEHGKKHVVELVENFPFNRISAISFYPTVKPGDKVNVGDLLAHSNFTDKHTGAINMGSNLKVAVMPYRGFSYEDAQVISESAANKMMTERLYGFDQDNDDKITVGKNKYISIFPRKFTKEQVERFDDQGVIKPGTVVNQGDPLILAVGPKLLTSADAQLGKLHKVLRNAYADKSVIWDHSFPGVVADVAMTGSMAKVNVKSTPPVQIGDKLSTLYGLKGVVGAVVPDDKMPRDAVTGQPYDMLLNPMGILSRVAPAQIVEMQLAKLAKQQGQPMRLPQLPPPEGWATWAENQLKLNNVSEVADVFDPDTGKTIKDISDGYVYVSAFHHLADKKLSARGEQGSYTMDEQPAKGGPEGAKRYSSMDVLATLAHGAPEVIKDAILIRGTRNEEFWKALRAGRPLPEPQVPFIYQKFLNTLRAGGVNVVDKGDTVSVMPMMDSDIKSLSKGAISDGRSVNSNFEPIPGGLFDVGKTGGMAGNRWTHVDLNEAMPHPIMEDPIRRLLGLRVKDFRDILSGKQQLNGLTGGRALLESLKSIDIDKEIDKNLTSVFQSRGSKRDNAVKSIGYLSAAKKQGIHPSNWILTKVPVLPPIFRPISRMGDVALVPDMNDLYASLIEINKQLAAQRKELPESALGDQKLNLYDAVTSAFGLGEPVGSSEGKNLKGAIRQVIGSSPKCYDDATEVLTNKGWIPFSEATSDLLFGTLNPATKALEYQQASSVLHLPYSDVLVSIKTDAIDLLVTPNHHHFVSLWNTDTGMWESFTKVTAGELIDLGCKAKFLTDEFKSSTVVDCETSSFWKAYSGLVHCATVKNGLLMVRRNGLTAVSGNSGMFQSKVMSKTVGAVGRGVVTPDPNMDMDSIGIPEDSAWTLYKDFIMRRLVRSGYNSLKAFEMIEQRDQVAKSALEDEMRQRPVLVDRAPTWHKFNILAFYPHITDDSTVHVSPLVTKGFTMDHDGDTVNFHVPVSDKAVVQAKDKMLPSRNLFSLTDLKSIRHSPSMEMTLGLYWLTKQRTDKAAKRFASVAEAKKAYNNGTIGLNDPIVIG